MKRIKKALKIIIKTPKYLLTLIAMIIAACGVFWLSSIFGICSIVGIILVALFWMGGPTHEFVHDPVYKGEFGNVYTDDDNK